MDISLRYNPDIWKLYLKIHEIRLKIPCQGCKGPRKTESSNFKLKRVSFFKNMIFVLSFYESFYIKSANIRNLEIKIKRDVWIQKRFTKPRSYIDTYFQRLHFSTKQETKRVNYSIYSHLGLLNCPTEMPVATIYLFSYTFHWTVRWYIHWSMAQ